jgi:hypothetical protein
LGRVRNDQYRRLVCVLVANANHLKRLFGPSGIVSPGRHKSTVLSIDGGSAGVPSSRSSLKVKVIQSSYPGPDGRFPA